MWGSEECAVQLVGKLQEHVAVLLLGTDTDPAVWMQLAISPFRFLAVRPVLNSRERITIRIVNTKFHRQQRPSKCVD